MCRALLGLLEGGLVPAATFLLSTWYTRYEIQMRFAGFYVIGNASSGLSGLLAYGIEKLNGTDGLGGWRWIFIVVSNTINPLQDQKADCSNRRALLVRASASLHS